MCVVDAVCRSEYFPENITHGYLLMSGGFTKNYREDEGARGAGT